MQHFYENIDGWFSYAHLYQEAVRTAKPGARFVEIGSFKGRSSAFLAVEIINSGKNIQLDLIDTWAGSSEHQAGAACEVKEVVEGTLYETFLKNMEPVKGHYNAIRLSSQEAVHLFPDNSIDFIMIDGEHTVEAVTKDILAYLPKMKKGGIMTGDDAWPADATRPAAYPWVAASKELAKYGVTFPSNHFYAVIS